MIDLFTDRKSDLWVVNSNFARVDSTSLLLEDCSAFPLFGGYKCLTVADKATLEDNFQTTSLNRLYTRKVAKNGNFSYKNGSLFAKTRKRVLKVVRNLKIQFSIRLLVTLPESLGEKLGRITSSLGGRVARSRDFTF